MICLNSDSGVVLWDLALQQAQEKQNAEGMCLIYKIITEISVFNSSIIAFKIK